MILGIGIDLLNLERIETLLLKFNEEHLIKKILSIEEAIEYKKSNKNLAKFLGKKFSVKESFSKALGIGIGRGVNFEDITVTNDIMGKPIIILSEKAALFLEDYYKVSISDIKIDVSTTDENPFVNSLVIISRT